jgi:hypothetical protein
MIRIDFKEPDTPSWKRWKVACTAAAATLKNLHWWEADFEISDIYRRRRIKKEVYLAKDGPFRGRCAYCEASIADFQHGDIEHFRPKKAVTDDKDNPVVISGPDGRQHEHPGYYWLAYDWKNLLPSCISCNQPGEHNIGKRTRFPTANGYYVTPEQDVGAEQPLLINPVDPADDDPETHLTVDFETGNLTHPNSARGAKCIEVFGLNKRDQLVTDRNTALNDVKADFVKVVFASPAVAQQLIDKLKRMEGGGFSHTLARRAQLKELKRRYGL